MNRLFPLIVIMLVACQPSASTPTPSSFPPTVSLPATDTPVPEPTATETLAATLVSTIPASTVELEGAEVPPGFSLIKFADLYRPTGFDFDGQGRLFVTSQDGNIYILHFIISGKRQDEQLNNRCNKYYRQQRFISEYLPEFFLQ